MDEREQRAARDAARRLQELERTLGKNWMADVAAAAGAAAEAQRRYVISGFDSIVRGWAGTWDRLRPSIEMALKSLAEALPQNWTDVDFGDAVTLAEAGWPIIWVPRPSLVRELGEGDDDDARDEILVAKAPEILADVLAALEGVTSRGESVIADALREAAESGIDGRWIACQATAAVALDTLVGAETLIYEYRSELKDRYSDDNTALYELRLALILRALPEAFARFYVRKGDAIPKRFNRNATVHALSYDQLTQRNAVFGLMLTTSLFRELAEYGDREVVVHELVLRRATIVEPDGDD